MQYVQMQQVSTTMMWDHGEERKHGKGSLTNERTLALPCQYILIYHLYTEKGFNICGLWIWPSNHGKVIAWRYLDTACPLLLRLGVAVAQNAFQHSGLPVICQSLYRDTHALSVCINELQNNNRSVTKYIVCTYYTLTKITLYLSTARLSVFCSTFFSFNWALLVFLLLRSLWRIW